MAYIVNIPLLRLGENKVFLNGDRIDLSSDLASKLLRKAYIKFDTEPQKTIYTQAPKIEKLIPDGNVEIVQEYISAIEDVELLQKMVLEEQSGKKRKTVLEAIEERIEELLNEEAISKDGDDVNITFNPNDVIADG